MGDTWWLYMILCRGGGIYIGIARDVEARFWRHKEGRGAFYTRLNPPIEIIARKEFGSFKEARQAERAIKRLSPKNKRRAACCLGWHALRDGADVTGSP